VQESGAINPVAPVYYTNESETQTSTQSVSSPILGSITSSSTTIPTENSTIIVGQQDAQEAPESCNIFAYVEPQHMVGDAMGTRAVTYFSWQVFNMPTSTRGTAKPLDITAGNFPPANLWPQDGQLNSMDWNYYSGGVVATFNNATCTTYFPIESSYTFVPTSTIYSTPTPQ
jgi:hypothetical protein